VRDIGAPTGASNPQDKRQQHFTEYDLAGNPTSVHAQLAGNLPLDRFHASAEIRQTRHREHHVESIAESAAEHRRRHTRDEESADRSISPRSAARGHASHLAPARRNASTSPSTRGEGHLRGRPVSVSPISARSRLRQGRPAHLSS
jgi:hypothetical protein